MKDIIDLRNITWTKKAPAGEKLRWKAGTVLTHNGEDYYEVTASGAWQKLMGNPNENEKGNEAKVGELFTERDKEDLAVEQGA